MLSYTKNIRRLSILLSIILFAAMISSRCGGSSGSGSDNSAPPENIIPLTMFGATIQWNSMADKTGDGGDLISDRSFRTLNPAATSFHPGNFPFVNGMSGVWVKFPSATSNVTFANTVPADAVANYPGGRIYPGYLRIKQDGGFTGVQQVIFPSSPINFFLKDNTSYTLRFSSYGVSVDTNTKIGVYLTNVDSDFAASKSDISPSDGAWQHHDVTLTTNDNGSICYMLAIYLISSNPADEILIDEVRLFETGKTPEFKTEVKTKITELGIRSLRYPGGTLTDFFFWKDSVGSIEKRGEMMTYNTLETPVIGLHEFLNFCEANLITPLIQVNVLDTSDNAADLVEYILGSSSTTQGAIRAANGRTAPWNATLFEIGNEPVSFYKDINLSETGRNYAILTKAIIAKMKAKAVGLGKTIQVGGISEAAFQVADWMTPTTDLLTMLSYWNKHVFTDEGLASKADFALGHFYSSRYLHSNTEQDYRWILSGGEVLKKTIDEKIKPHTGELPLWITEYHVTVENSSNVIQTSYSNDYQSGLAIADMLLMMMNNGVRGAYVHNLAQENCWGLINYKQNWGLRPAGHVFKLLSPAAGERILSISVDSTEVYTITTGAGNVPTGLQYPLITAAATTNKISGKPRVFLINRDFASDKTVTITLEGFTPGSAVQYLYTNSSVTADNETDTSTVGITQSTVDYSDPFTVTIPAHSCMRIDF